MQRLLLLVLLGCFAPVPALATFLANGHFDTDVSDWSTSEPVSFVWDIHDVDADPSSGSLILTTMPAGMNSNFHGVLSECVPVTAGEDLGVSAWVNITSSQPGSVQATISVQQFSSPNCQALDLVVTDNSPITTLLDQWVELTFVSIIQSPAISAQVHLQARDSGGGMQFPTTTQWDAVFLPEPSGFASLLPGAVLVAVLAHRRR